MNAPYTPLLEQMRDAASFRHAGGRPPRHGKHGTAMYRAWAAMIQRCINPSVESYSRYGGRGIVVCERWRLFDNFLADMGEPPAIPRCSLDRIDNNGNYEPGNCRWATPREQTLNRRTNRLLTVDGETMPVSLAAERFSISKYTLVSRLDRGWSDHDAVHRPLEHGGWQRR